MNWERQSHWHEAEGAKPARRQRTLITVSQDIKRADIVETLCKELTQAGFTTRTAAYNRDTRCSIDRLEQQICFVRRVMPHYLSEDTRKWAKTYLDQLTEIRRKRRPRIPFTCPP